MKTGQVHGKTARRHTSADFIGFLTDIVERKNPVGNRNRHLVLDNPVGLTQDPSSPGVLLDQNPQVRFLSSLQPIPRG